MLDAAIYVLKGYRLADGRYKLKVRWVLKDGRDMGFLDKITVSREEIGNWYEI
jgi:hypothetical protein